MSGATRDWDARTYHRVSAPHQEWADALIDRLALRGDETLLDAGCGSGRVTLKLVERLPRGTVVAVDGAASMVAQARETLGGHATVLGQDLLDLTLEAPVDAVFSSAVFHWIADHERLFARLHEALAPGGRLVAQCGGAGNIDAFRASAATVSARDPYRPYFAGWSGAWNYATPDDTEARLREAGFDAVHAWLQPWPVTPPEPAAYVESVCLGADLERLPAELRAPFVAAVLAACGDPLELDYVRLNIDARRPGGPASA